MNTHNTVKDANVAEANGEEWVAELRTSASGNRVSFRSKTSAMSTIAVMKSSNPYTALYETPDGKKIWFDPYYRNLVLAEIKRQPFGKVLP